MNSSLPLQSNTTFAPTLLETRFTINAINREHAFGHVSASEVTKDLPEAFAPEYCVRNTFIDSVPSRRPSLEDFLPRARCFSAPSHNIACRMRQPSAIEPVPEEVPVEWGASGVAFSGYDRAAPPSQNGAWGMVPLFYNEGRGGAYSHGELPFATMAQSNLYYFEVATVAPPVFASAACPSQPSSSQLEQWAEPRLMRYDATLGSRSVEVRSACELMSGGGSTAHAAGLCKPCAWYHSAKGCQTGLLCEFCHACGPGELKRRKKQKNMLMAAHKANREAQPKTELPEVVQQAHWREFDDKA